MPRETEIEMAERHVREGESHVARQNELVGQLRIDGHNTRAAEELLVEFETILAEHKEHLALIHSRDKSRAKP